MEAFLFHAAPRTTAGGSEGGNTLRARKRRITFLAIFLILTMAVTAGLNLYLQQRRAEVSARGVEGKAVPSSATGLESGMRPGV